MTVMQPLIFQKRSRISAPASVVFDWHLREGAFERLNPPWEPVRIVSKVGGIADGGQVELDVPIGPLRQRWVSKHQGFVAGVQFQDVQLRGPFASCIHTHRVEPDGPEACYLDDRLEYTLPFGPLGTLGRSFVATKLDRMFAYRHQLTAADIATHQTMPAGVKSMKILVVGATGLVGSALVPLLTTGGHNVVQLSRSPAKPGGTPTITWDPLAGSIPANELEGFDAVIHLAGEGVAARSWTAAQKKRILDSRVIGTNLSTFTSNATIMSPSSGWTRSDCRAVAGSTRFANTFSNWRAVCERASNPTTGGSLWTNLNSRATCLRPVGLSSATIAEPEHQQTRTQSTGRTPRKIHVVIPS